MRIYLLIGLSLFLLLILAACAPKEIVCNKPYIRFGNDCCTDINDNKLCDTDEKELICQKPYIKVGLDCCLDENDNAICDKDEQKVETEPIRKATKEITVDWCGKGEGVYFDCRYGFLWKDSIEFKLSMIKQGKLAIKRLIFKQLDCKMEIPKESQRKLNFHDDIVFDVPCNITLESVDTDINIIADYYSPDYDESYPPTEVQIDETIGGIVRDRYGPLNLKNSLAEGLVTSTCEFSSDVFKCTKHSISQNQIELRLISSKSSKLVIKKIELPFVPCFKEFADLSEGTMELGEEKTFILPCEMRREFAKSNIEITYDEYLPKMDNNNERIPGKYEDTALKRFLKTGWISGMIR